MAGKNRLTDRTDGEDHINNVRINTVGSYYHCDVDSTDGYSTEGGREKKCHSRILLLARSVAAGRLGIQWNVQALVTSERKAGMTLELIAQT